MKWELFREIIIVNSTISALGFKGTSMPARCLIPQSGTTMLFGFIIKWPIRFGLIFHPTIKPPLVDDPSLGPMAGTIPHLLSWTDCFTLLREKGNFPLLMLELCLDPSHITPLFY